MHLAALFLMLNLQALHLLMKIMSEGCGLSTTSSPSLPTCHTESASHAKLPASYSTHTYSVFGLWNNWPRALEVALLSEDSPVSAGTFIFSAISSVSQSYSVAHRDLGALIYCLGGGIQEPLEYSTDHESAMRVARSQGKVGRAFCGPGQSQK